MLSCPDLIMVLDMLVGIFFEASSVLGDTRQEIALDLIDLGGQNHWPEYVTSWA